MRFPWLGSDRKPAAGFMSSLHVASYIILPVGVEDWPVNSYRREQKQSGHDPIPAGIASRQISGALPIKWRVFPVTVTQQPATSEHCIRALHGSTVLRKQSSTLSKCYFLEIFLIGQQRLAANLNSLDERIRIVFGFNRTYNSILTHFAAVSGTVETKGKFRFLYDSAM